MPRKIFLTLFVLLVNSAVIYAEDAPQQFQGFDLAGYGEGGKKTWDVKGDHADMVGDTVELTDIVANAYGEEKTNLTAQQGTLDKASGKMHLEKDVVITTDQGATLETDSLDWEREKDLVTTPDKVVITKDGMTATGTGAVAHPNLNTAQLNEDITVQLEPKPEDSIGDVVTITCDGPLEMDYKGQKAVFNDNVIAIQTDRKLMADKMEVSFDAVTKQIQQMTCRGHVSIIQGENTTYSNEAVYNAQDQKLTLSGSPKLIFYTDNKNTLPFKAKPEAELTTKEEPIP